MSQAMTQFVTQQGYTPPRVTQFSVFLDNRVGRLLELLERFDSHPVAQVCAFSVHEATDHAVVRLITNSSSDARDVLKESRLPFAEHDLLVVELRGDLTLTRMCLYLLGAELNIHFAYPVMLRPNGSPTIALAVDDMLLAGQILRQKNFRLLGECDLPSRGSAGEDDD
jgi:hypothetical protein